jgi:hypothetical protein
VRDPARDRASAAAGGSGGDGEGRRRSRGAEAAEAAEAQRALYDDVRAALRSPIVPHVVRRLASGWPALFARLWPDLKANLLSRAFESHADLLRQAAAREAAEAGALRAGAYRDALRDRALSTSVVDDIVHAVDVALYLDAKVLVLAAILDRALDPAASAEPGEEPSDEGRDTIPPGVPPEAADVPVLGDTEAPGRILRLWNDAVATVGLPAVSDDLRVLARWPDFLEIAWHAAKPHLSRPGVADLGTLADEAARRLPVPIASGPETAAEAGLEPEAIVEVRGFVRQVRQALPPLLFTMALARHGLDETGAAASGASPFPV